MGVDYSASWGYGFEIPYEEADLIAERLGYPESEWGFDPDEFCVWLIDGTGLVYDRCGNFMTGDDMYLIITAPDVSKHIDIYGWDGSFKKFNTNDAVDPEHIIELENVYTRVYGCSPNEGDISWYASTTVS